MLNKKHIMILIRKQNHVPQMEMVGDLMIRLFENKHATKIVFS